MAHPFRNSREAYKAEGGAEGVDGERTEYEGAQRRRNKVQDPGISVPVLTPPSPFKGGSTGTGTGIDWDSAPLPPNWERRADKDTAKVGDVLLTPM